MCVHLSQNHRMFGVGRDLCGSSSPTPLPKQGHPEQAAQDCIQADLHSVTVVYAVLDVVGLL